MAAPTLDKLLVKLKRYPSEPMQIVALDPGETTGWAVANFSYPFDPRCAQCDQEVTESISEGVDVVLDLIERFTPDLIIIENYRVYSWKSDQHKWSDIPTLRLIGAFESICYLQGIDYIKQMASKGKEFCTDEKLQHWQLYTKGKKHGRDAMRHICSYMLFGEE